MSEYIHQYIDDLGDYVLKYKGKYYPFTRPWVFADIPHFVRLAEEGVFITSNEEEILKDFVNGIPEPTCTFLVGADGSVMCIEGGEVSSGRDKRP